jgi:chromate reductase
MRILGISGSLRRDSHNTALLRAAAELLPPGAELELFDGLKAVPPYDEDDDVPGQLDPAVVAIKDAISNADAVLISTPEYNHSIPGVLKNALDWVSRPVKDNPLQGKPTAVVGASTGLFGAVWAQAEVRKVLGAIGAEVVDRELPVMRAHMQFDDYGNLREEDLRDQLAEHVAALVAAVPDAPASGPSAAAPDPAATVQARTSVAVSPWASVPS